MPFFQSLKFRHFVHYLRFEFSWSIILVSWSGALMAATPHSDVPLFNVLASICWMVLGCMRYSFERARAVIKAVSEMGDKIDAQHQRQAIHEGWERKFNELMADKDKRLNPIRKKYGVGLPDRRLARNKEKT